VRLQGAALFDLIQFECLERRRGVARVRDGGRSGLIYFREGNVVHASEGELVGEAALRSLLRWKRGVFESCEAPWPTAESITRPWQNLLLAIAQEQDEAREGSQRNGHSTTTKDAVDLLEDKGTIPGKAAEPPRAPPAYAFVRLTGQGVPLIPGDGEAGQQLASLAAYAAQLADLIGDLLVGSGVASIEVATRSGSCLVNREPGGDLLAVKGGRSADPGALRRAVGLGREGK
jgi:hypothetical protein